MTKSEVRAVSVSKLELCRDNIVYDIGAGTGSVSVEAALKVPEGHVYAFEQKEEGCALIRANAEKAGVKNLTVVPGKAPESLYGYPAPDRVFLGGSSGNMEEILDLVTELNPAVQLVINVIALESLSQAMEWFRKKGWEPEVVCMQVSRAAKRGPYHMMQAQNPIYVLTAQGQQTHQSQNVPVVPGQNERAQKDADFPRILVAAPGSGSGKTLLTTGLLTLFQNRGIRCRSFKCGPDYIDPMFHKYVLGIDSCNLDSFFLPQEELRALFQKRAADAELSILEGVMGYYDGIGGNSTAASTYEVAKITDTPVILVLDGKGSSLSLAAQVKGFLDYRKDSHICGVILNKTNKMVGERLRPEIEKLGVRYLGAVPVCETMDIKSRHLGLTMPQEQSELRGHLNAFAKQLEEYLDVDGILELAGCSREKLPEAGKTEQSNQTDLNQEETKQDEIRPIDSESEPPTRRMAVAMDKAFCFYYQENLDFLRQHGWELIPFSPLHDAALPEQVHAILLGGGYPELYAKELSANEPMLASIRNAHAEGIKILAECGGFLYLQEHLEDETGTSWPVAGLIHADGFRTEKLGRFGYISLMQNGAVRIKGHEFHYWDSTAPGSAFRAEKPQSNRGWDCMYWTDSLLAGFPHLYYLSGPDLILSFLSGPEGEETT
ncbi:MAG: cobyrinate a,c-diamide synthase [Clostridiaceae bacterium]|nr:cobyrinate a,c-diamide synthase [Clostridiaceae bacterium]